MNSREGFGLRDEKLRKIYSTTSGPVAFIDESYRQPGRGERPFYTMSAAIIGRTTQARRLHLACRSENTRQSRRAKTPLPALVTLPGGWS